MYLYYFAQLPPNARLIDKISRVIICQLIVHSLVMYKKNNQIFLYQLTGASRLEGGGASGFGPPNRN